MSILNDIVKKSKQDPKKIVFAEGFDERIIKAAIKLGKKNICKPILLGNPQFIKSVAKANLKYFEIVDFENSTKLIDSFAKKILKIREKKGMDMSAAIKWASNRNYFGTMMVRENLADGFISGARCSTADTIRPSLQLMKSKKKASSCFLMTGKTTFFFADCAIQINPSEQELADIAIDTASTAKRFGLFPKVAMLSFSTKGSAKHEFVNKVTKALEIAKKKDKSLVIDGEFQLDAAIVPSVAKLKAPNSNIIGDANVLIFPDLNAGNIGYKLAQRLGNLTAIGPIMQGLSKPVNDLSRGCSIDDIVYLAAITNLEARGKI